MLNTDIHWQIFDVNLKSKFNFVEDCFKYVDNKNDIDNYVEVAELV